MHALHEDPMSVLCRCEFGHVESTDNEAQPKDTMAESRGEDPSSRETDRLVEGSTAVGRDGLPTRSKHYGKGRYSRVEMVESTEGDDSMHNV